MKAPVLALFLLLEGTQALWLDVEASDDPPPVTAQKPEPVDVSSSNSPATTGGMGVAWGPPAKAPEIQQGTGEVLMSGDEFSLESEVVPGLFVSMRPGKPDEMGAPMQWLEMRHITNGPMGLERGPTPQSTFAMANPQGETIKSGDMVKWIHGKKSQIDLLMGFKSDNYGETAFMWPHPLAKKPLNFKEPGDFLIEHAREVDLKEMTSRPNFLGAWGFDQKLKKDTRKGEAIKDGDSVWIRHRSTTGSTSGDWLWMSGDPGEGFHVSFPHHFPGFDGWVKHYAPEHWMKGGNDPHATAQRFTIRKVRHSPTVSPQAQGLTIMR